MGKQAWPDPAAYVEGIQNPSSFFVDRDLKSAQPAVTRLGMPLVYSGNFASVFRVRDAEKDLAVRCFLRSGEDRQARYRKIGDYLDTLNPYPRALASFEYMEEGVQVGGSRYPILVMEWMTGLTLDKYVLSDGGTARSLRALASSWCRLVDSLESSGIAHGDLQHGNIIVDRDVRLVDYDGMFVPGLSGWKSAEIGHPAYQHPARSNDDFDVTVDRFSALVVYASLVALSENPGLRQLCSSDGLLFRRRDFEDASRSATFRDVRRAIKNESDRAVLDALETSCRNGSRGLPRLVELVGDVSPTTKLPPWMTGEAGISPPTSEPEEAPRQTPPGSGRGSGRSTTHAGTFICPDCETKVRPVVAPTALNVKIRCPVCSAIFAPFPVAKPPASPYPTSAPPRKPQGGGGSRPKPGWMGGAQPAPPSTTGGTASPAPGRAGSAQQAWETFKECLSAAVAALFIGAIAAGFFGSESAGLVIGGAAFAFFLWGVLSREMKSSAKPSGQAPTSSKPKTTYPLPQPHRKRHVVRSPGRSASSKKKRLVASKIRNKYHEPWCEWAGKISTRNRIEFASTGEAASRGYRPCKVCRP